MTERPAPEDISLRINVILSDWQDALFERFDELHKRGINDDDVIRHLRKDGLHDLAQRYIGWADCIDPDAEDDNTTMSPVVPDPGDAPSYTSLDKARIPPGHTRFYPEGGGTLDIPDHLVDSFRRGGAEALTLDEKLGAERGDRESWPATPGELTKELTDAGINASNLEKSLIDAYNENRINKGLFYAERSNDGVHWHVYKRRNKDDSGAYIATADNRKSAQWILDSLGTGTIEGR